MDTRNRTLRRTMASVSALFIYPLKLGAGVSVESAIVLPHGLGITVRRDAARSFVQDCVRTLKCFDFVVHSCALPGCLAHAPRTTHH